MTIDHVAALRTIRDAQVLSFGDPRPQPKYVAETVVCGRQVQEWARDVDKLIEHEQDRIRELPVAINLDSDSAPQKPLVFVDLTEHFPTLVSDAVYRWRRAGSHTEADETLSKVEALREEAEKFSKLSHLENDRAHDYKKAGDLKKYEQHLRYFETNRTKSEKLDAEANAIATEWKKAHP